MLQEVSKCDFLQAMALKMLGRPEEAFSVLQVMHDSPEVRSDAAIYGQVLVHIGSFYSSAGDFDAAGKAYAEALPIIKASNRAIAVAELKWSIGDTLRSQGRRLEALEAYRSTLQEYRQLEMRKFVVMVHLVTAELLIELSRPREAEWELLAAFPTIEEERMVPEGFAAIALLKESVRRRKTDPSALRELREHLQAVR
jgi:tetratricopeptide (TPR) repeat protein